MPENPYESPRAESLEATPPGMFDPLLAEELRTIANYQRSIQYCILVQVGAYILGMMVITSTDKLDPGLRMPASILSGLLGIAVIGGAVVGGIFAVLLALRVYNVVLAIIFGMSALIPCIGLMGLFVINQRATSRLLEFQIPVGLLGADLQALEERIRQMQRFGMPPNPPTS